MGNDKTIIPSGTGTQSGCFGNIVSSIGGLAKDAAPLVTAFSNKGAKDPEPNASQAKGRATLTFGNGGGIPTMWLVIGGGLLLLAGAAFFFFRKGGR